MNIFSFSKKSKRIILMGTGVFLLFFILGVGVFTKVNNNYLRTLQLSDMAKSEPAKAAGTTPTISNVAGTIQTGQTITITGANMMTDQMSSWSTCIFSKLQRIRL